MRIFLNGDVVELIGNRPYYVFENGVVEERNAGLNNASKYKVKSY